MATTQARDTAARTGEQFLEGLRGDAREIWLNGEQITHPLEHDELRAAAESMASVFDLQHEHADEMLAPSPDDGRLVNVTHLVPRSREDLERRRRAIELAPAGVQCVADQARLLERRHRNRGSGQPAKRRLDVRRHRRLTT